MTKTDDQIREIAQDAIAEMIEEHTIENSLVRWLDQRYNYLDHDTVNRVVAAIGDARVSVTW